MKVVIDKKKLDRLIEVANWARNCISHRRSENKFSNTATSEEEQVYCALSPAIEYVEEELK